jgi:hypothetical protein
VDFPRQRSAQSDRRESKSADGVVLEIPPGPVSAVKYPGTVRLGQLLTPSGSGCHSEYEAACSASAIHTVPNDLVSLEYSRSVAHRLNPSVSRSRGHGHGGHAVTRDHHLRTRGSGLWCTAVSSPTPRVCTSAAGTTRTSWPAALAWSATWNDSRAASMSAAQSRALLALPASRGSA